MTVADVARELYGLPPEEFTSARNARAKEATAAGDPDLAAQVQSLRKPTTAAWLLNQLVRAHADEVAQVLSLGAELRAAQGTVAADELRALDRQRRRLTHAVAQQARVLGRDAGRRVSEQVAAAVEETLRSAMVDPDAGEALSSGLLTDTFSATGVEPVDLRAVVALGAPEAPPAPAAAASAASHARRSAGQRKDSAAEAGDERAARDAARRRAVDGARRELAEAEAVLEKAEELSGRARVEADAAGRERRQREAERAEMRRRLDELDRLVAQAVTADDAATRSLATSVAAQASAADGVEAARRHVHTLLGDETEV